METTFILQFAVVHNVMLANHFLYESIQRSCGFYEIVLFSSFDVKYVERPSKSP